MNAFLALVTLELTHVRRRRTPWVAGVTAALIVVIAALAHHAGGAPPDDVLADGAYAWLVRMLALLLAYVFAAGNLGEELAARTLVYLTVRPLPRAAIVGAKWLVAAAVSSLLLVCTAIALELSVGLGASQGVVRGLGFALRVGVAASLESAACAAVGMLYGALLPQASGALTVLHLAWFELALSFAPGRLRLFSLAHHALELAGLPRRGFMSEAVPSLPLAAHVLVLLVGCSAWLAAAMAVFSVREYRGSEGT